MRLRLTEFRPRTGPHTHRVVQPRTPLRHTSLRDPENYGLLLGDHDGLNRLAGLFSFAAYSRHTIVHVPLRAGIPPRRGPGRTRRPGPGPPGGGPAPHPVAGAAPQTGPRHPADRPHRRGPHRAGRESLAGAAVRARAAASHHARVHVFPDRRAGRLRDRRHRLRLRGLGSAAEARRQGARGVRDRTARRTGPGPRDLTPPRGRDLLQAVSAVRPLQATGPLSQSSTPDNSLALMSSGAAEARTDCRASSASSASEKP